MERTPVKSSNIASIGYDVNTSTMEVEFRNGGIYQYPGVTTIQRDQMLKAPSIGTHFHKFIRPKFKAVKVGEKS